MPKEEIISQLEESGPWQGESIADTEHRVLRRIVTEILPWIEEWIENKDSLTIKAIRDTIRNKKNFESADDEQWKNILEEFCERNIEVIILRQPLEIDGLLRQNAKNSKETKNPLIKRLVELEGAAEETLLLAWHRDHGCIAASMPEISETCRQFPRRHRWLTWRLDDLNDQVTFWSWDRKNFKK
jgi:hypothetical protein